MSNITEESLARLVNSDKCRTVRIDGKNYWISKKVKNEIKNHPKYKEGGFAFLAAIPAIIAGLAGAAGVASGVASTVANSRQAIKTQKEIDLIEGTGVNLKTESEAAKGTGVNLKTEKNLGKGIYLKNENHESKGTDGSGIYLKPHEGSAIHKYFKNIFDDVELKNSTKNFKDGLEIEISGGGLFLKPYNYYDKNGHSDED